MKTFKNETLKEVYELAKNAGYKLYTSENSENYISYFYIINGNAFGYCQADYFFGVRFSTSHKPNNVYGTGFSIQSKGITNVNISLIDECFDFIPKWARFSREYEGHVKKYSSFDEFLKTNTILKYYEL